MGTWSGRRGNSERARSVGLRSAAALAGLIGALLFPAGASAAEVTFEHTGSAQQWVVPAGVTSATFHLDGGQGGYGVEEPFFPFDQGGLGAHLRATIDVSPGQVLQIFVGGGPVYVRDNVAAGGFNGGGAAGPGGGFYFAGGGGGATDMRTGPNLADRILIAAGGGGGGGNGGGGAAGGTGGNSEASGDDGTDFDATTLGGGGGGPGGGASGGTAGTGGAGADFNGIAGDVGSEGEGGDGHPSLIGVSGGGGGGGGGLYGGGSGGTGGVDQGGEPSADRGGGGGGGGGGSSFAVASATGVALDPAAHEGLGYAVITYADPPDPPVVTPKPSPRITHKPKNRKLGKGKKNRKNKRYVFRFADDVPGVSFLCKLDQRPFTPCTSPAIYRGLKPGRHTFAVKSITAAGVESTPQTTTFKVPRSAKVRRR